MDFGRCCMLRVRNLYGHEPGPGELADALSALSLLARWIGEAVVESLA
jgi:hypothetical protein